MTYPLVFFIVSLVVSAVGWFYFIYFFSVGYGLSIAILAAASVVIFRDVMTCPTLLLCVTFIIYGIRLALYLIHRERRSVSYKKILYQPDNTQKKPIFVMLMIWISCALLYVCQISPLNFYLYNSSRGLPVCEGWMWAGTVVVILGVVIEIVADKQKSSAKKINPRRFVDTGLYRIVRCPNYFGELLMWTGSFFICFGSCCSLIQWIIASIGYIGIIYVMFSGARRLELRQIETYGKDPEFRGYIKKTPLIIPFVPIYSVVKYSWLKA